MPWKTVFTCEACGGVTESVTPYPGYDIECVCVTIGTRALITICSKCAEVVKANPSILFVGLASNRPMGDKTNV